MSSMGDNNSIRSYYNIIANEYARDYFEELKFKPFDREILLRFCELTKNFGLVCDIGCGPGEIARFLKNFGVDVLGIDLSEEMIKEAIRLNPDILFRIGDMKKLQLNNDSLSGITAFYAIVNLTLEEVKQAIKEFYRVIKENGHLLISFHIGDNEAVTVEKTVHKEKVFVDFRFFNIDDILKIIEDIGFNVMETIIRYPYRGVEYESKRAYILAKKI